MALESATPRPHSLRHQSSTALLQRQLGTPPPEVVEHDQVVQTDN